MSDVKTGRGRWVKIERLSEIHDTDRIRNVGSDKIYVVMANYGSHVTAAATVDVTNPIEWEIFVESAH